MYILAFVIALMEKRADYLAFCLEICLVFFVYFTVLFCQDLEAIEVGYDCLLRHFLHAVGTPALVSFYDNSTVIDKNLGGNYPPPLCQSKAGRSTATSTKLLHYWCKNISDVMT